MPESQVLQLEQTLCRIVKRLQALDLDGLEP